MLPLAEKEGNAFRNAYIQILQQRNVGAGGTDSTRQWRELRQTSSEALCSEHWSNSKALDWMDTERIQAALRFLRHKDAEQRGHRRMKQPTQYVRRPLGGILSS
ncbi:hypothetical protein I79_000400 [Cricetulus griseus]|uniref:Uncharacterized protein n=1 Tax=Cricetulus griseus TaxID=10029 RepID=G3GS86_CRIGR|nr:hypothetical protein I79_000400 [Cricetulus griseus]